jgi:hypothetical protein
MLVTLGCFARGDTPLERLLQQPMSTLEHSLVARRYRERAAEARRIAATHEVMAARYRDGAAGDGQLGEEMVAHCRALARDYDDAASRYEALAANHASLAATWRDAPGRETPEDRGP